MTRLLTLFLVQNVSQARRSSSDGYGAFGCKIDALEPDPEQRHAFIGRKKHHALVGKEPKKRDQDFERTTIGETIVRVLWPISCQISASLFEDFSPAA
ncbi:hypothetical protein [Agrobacterium sp. P15N1-A]|uniref:hypothetical protein n=1 Tax=Agrobacterium sp. P15N1-A TaxID=3342820 RepID=UPI0037D93609